MSAERERLRDKIAERLYRYYWSARTQDPPRPWGTVSPPALDAYLRDADEFLALLDAEPEPCREEEASATGAMGAKHDADQHLADVAGRMKAYGYDERTLRVLLAHLLGGAEIPMPSPEPDARYVVVTEGRVESGPVQFGDDWPGLFLRGDMAMSRALQVRGLAEERKNAGDWIMAANLEGFADQLASCQEPCDPIRVLPVGTGPRVEPGPVGYVVRRHNGTWEGARVWRVPPEWATNGDRYTVHPVGHPDPAPRPAQEEDDG